MSTRSVSALRICDIAVVHFAEHGYDGSSLHGIASQAGMRKPSLYAHFAGKDALFLEAFASACNKEREFIAARFADTVVDRLPGEEFVMALQERYSSSPHLRMLLRCAYVPPAEHRDRITDDFLDIQQSIAARLAEQLAVYQNVYGRTEDVTEMYLGIVDSLHVELMYGSGDSFERRRIAMWSMFATVLGPPT